MVCFVLVLVLDRQPNYAMRCEAQLLVDGHEALIIRRRHDQSFVLFATGCDDTRRDSQPIGWLTRPR